MLFATCTSAFLREHPPTTVCISDSLRALPGYHTRSCSRVKEENFIQHLQEIEPAFLALKSNFYC